MPSTAHFSLTVVDAVSETELREYRKGDETWIEGTPGNEFFVVVGCEVEDPVLCRLAVDGKDIGYQWITHRPTTSQPLGPLKCGQSLLHTDTNVVTHAFRFVEVEVAPEEADEAAGEAAGEEGALPGCGRVTAKWFVARPCGAANSSFVSQDWGGVPTGATSAADHKKDASVLRSAAGSMPGSVPEVSPTTYTAGEKLAELEIKYTTDFGLAVRGLYPKLQEAPKYAQPRRRKLDDVQEVSAASAKRVKKEEKEDKEDKEMSPKPEFVKITYRADGREVLEIED